MNPASFSSEISLLSRLVINRQLARWRNFEAVFLSLVVILGSALYANLWLNNALLSLSESPSRPQAVTPYQTDAVLATNTTGADSAAEARAAQIAASYRLRLINTKLERILNNFDASHPGVYGLRVATLDGHIHAEHLSNRTFVTASTYKLFLAYAVYHQAERGQLDLNSPLLGSYSVAECVYPMIVYSDNNCAIALEGRVGIANEEKLLLASGFKHTNINNSTTTGEFAANKISTPADEGLFLLKLAKGHLMNKLHTTHLLILMKTQVYRDGIPAGVPAGVAVADKVGFLYQWQHDVGIVYGPKVSYILVGMSEGGTRASLSTLSRQIYQLLTQKP